MVSGGLRDSAGGSGREKENASPPHTGSHRHSLLARSRDPQNLFRHLRTLYNSRDAPSAFLPIQNKQKVPGGGGGENLSGNQQSNIFHGENLPARFFEGGTNSRGGGEISQHAKEELEGGGEYSPS